MKEKLEILYPRSQAKIYIVEFDKEKEILKEMDLIENSELFKRYQELVKSLEDNKRQKARFVCGKCCEEYTVKDLTLYNFIRYSGGPDEWRYDDYNIICPKCGRFNYLNKDHIHHGFKNIEEVFK